MDYRSTENQNSKEAGWCCRGGRVQQVLLAVMIICVLHPASSNNLSTYLAPQDLIVEKDATILKLLPGYYQFRSQELPTTLCAVEGSYDASMVPRILLIAPLVFTCPKVTFYGFLKLEAPTTTGVVQLTGRLGRKQQWHPRKIMTARLAWHRRSRSSGPPIVSSSTCVNGLFVSIAETANITFTNCHSIKDGGALFATSLDVAGNITFNGCSAGAHGGAVFVQGDMNILTRAVATFNDCRAVIGGGLYTGGVLNVSGSVGFNDCNASGSGGGLLANGVLNVSGSVGFKGCKAQQGGGLFAAGPLIVSGSTTFHDCNAQGSGGGLAANGVLNVSGSVGFKGCKAQKFGGGLFAAGPLIVSGSATFHDCNAQGSGGGLVASGVLNFSGSVGFKGCKAQQGGGLLAAGLLIVSGSTTFHDCDAQVSGGGLLAIGALNVSGSAAFRGCLAHSNGGGLHVTGPFNLAGSATFEGCKAHKSGGGLFAESYLDISGSAAFDSCFAKFDGGGLSVNGWLNVSGSVAFENCTAHFGGGGMAGNATVRNYAKVTFTDCHSNMGGGFYFLGMFVHSGSSTFTRCHARAFGGGFYIEHGNLTLENVSFSHCSAAQVGGAAYAKYVQGISLAGEIRFDSCHSLGGIGSGLAVEEPSVTQLTIESNLRLSFINMCMREGESEILISANFEREPNFSAELLGVSGRTIDLATSLFDLEPFDRPEVSETQYPITSLRCMHCPFGKFSFKPVTRLGSTCIECEPLYNEVFENTLASFPCSGNVVQIPEGIMLTEQNGRYDAWICPNKDACEAMTINTSADVNVCKTGYNGTVTLPACATCSNGYGASQYDPFVCLKCSSSKMSLITPLFFYLLAIYSAGQQRKPMAAIQNIMISFVTISAASLSVLWESSSVVQLQTYIQVYINTLIDVGSVPMYRPSSSCLLPSCDEFACAARELGFILGLALLYFPSAEILHRVAALRGSHFGPQGDCRTRLMVQAAVASNYFMPTLIGAVLKLVPCVVIQNKVDGFETRSAWFASETCNNEEGSLWVVLSIFGAILCIAFGPVYHCCLIARAQQWSEDERQDALGFTLSIYSSKSRGGGFAKYWDAVIILRKMLFISVSILFPLSYNASEFSVATIGVMVFYLVVHMYVRPYRKGNDMGLNRLEDLSQITSLVSLLLSLSERDLIHPSLLSTATNLTIIAFINTATFMVIACKFFTVALQDNSIKSVVLKLGGKRGSDLIDQLNKEVDTGRPNQPLLSQTWDPVPDQERQRKSEDPVAVFSTFA